MERRSVCNDQEEKCPLEMKESDGDVKVEVQKPPITTILYKVSDVPPLPATCIFAFQVCLQVVSSAVTNAILISEAICGTSHVTAKLMSTSMFMAGMTTFLQAMFGVRLPVFQAPTIHYLVPILARADMPDWECVDVNQAMNHTSPASNGSDVMTTMVDDEEEEWQRRLNEISGVLMLVSVIHALIGATGIGGHVARVIGPLTVVPAVVVMILKIVDTLIKFTLIHLGVTFFTMCVLLILTTYMANMLAPIPYWSRGHGWKIFRTRFLRTYAVLISIGFGWLLCHILTVAGALPENPGDIQYHARTDNKGDTVELARWFYFPYPGQFGSPRLSLALFFGLFVGMLSSVIDSLADYNIISRVCQIPRPPAHATNRGLLIEGCCSILSGAFGAGLATSTNISVTGALAITGVTSRRVFQFAGLFLMFLGVVGKIGAFLVIIPKPVVGGVMLIILGSVSGVLLAELNEFDMKRPRNCMTVGLSIIMGAMVPKLVLKNQAVLDTGITQLNNVLYAMFGTPLFVAGVLACFLDNTLPGGRGQKTDLENGEPRTSGERAPVHRLPYIHDYLTSRKWTRFCPFLPGFRSTESK